MRRGQEALRARNYRAAQQAFEEAAAADKTRALPHKYLADIHAKQGRYAEAVAAARQALALNEKDADTHYNLGTYLLYTNPENPSEEVIQEMRRALELNGRLADAAQNLGYALFQRKRYEEAAEAFRQATRITPSWAPYHAGLGEALLYQGKLEEAAAAFEQAAADRRLKMLRDKQYRDYFCDIFLNWGKTEEKRGNLGTAKDHLRRLIATLGEAAEYRQQVDEGRRLLADIERRLAEEAEARRKKEEEALKQRQDTKAPVVTITGTDATHPGAAPAAAQAREVVIVAAGQDETTTILLTGVASDDVGVEKVTVAGEPATLYQARDLTVAEDLGVSVNFSAEVAVRPGENRIEVVATDRSGNQGRSVVVITGTRKERIEVASEAAQEVAQAASQKWAVLVGVNQYESKEITPLRFSVRDVRAIHEVLVDPKRAGFPPANVVLLTDDQAERQKHPTRRNVYDALYFLEQNAKPEDLVVIYYSGHGFRDRDSGKSYLLPLDTVTHDLESSAIPNDEFLARVARIQANKKVILLDACHSGGLSLGAKADAKLPTEYYEMLAKAEGTVTIASCSGDEQSYEYPGKGQGAFTYFLCEGLTGKADADGNGVVSFQEVSAYVVNSVSEWARRQRLKQTPLTHTGNARFDIPLSAVRAVELEQKRQKLLALFDDNRIQRYSIELLEREPKAMSDKEQLALTVLEQVLRGESRPELYLEIVQKFSLMT
ncbi:MAG: tetratricopeptide repeat protein [Armatimonadetes bacterium]|nr:tetratricopeptide repeat protein [Armatimonadota bacterium]